MYIIKNIKVCYSVSPLVTVAQGMQITCPITIECYLGDYVCPPKTVMALYNSVKTEKKIKFVQSARHSYFAPENEDVYPEF